MIFSVVFEVRAQLLRFVMGGVDGVQDCGKSLTKALVELKECPIEFCSRNLSVLFFRWWA